MISVIIPTLNEEKNLPNLLRCLENQTYKDFEIIVSDGNSEDRTQKLAKEYKCKLAVSKKRSPADQRNKGAEIAKGEYLIFIDADSLIPRNFLEKALKEFRRRKLGVAGFQIRCRSNNFFHRAFGDVYNLLSVPFQYFWPLSVSLIMTRKKYHDRIHGFNNKIRIGEDHNYSQRISGFGKFRIIRSTKFVFSTRRFEKDGLFLTVFKWIWIYFAGNKKTGRKYRYEYEFGKY